MYHSDDELLKKLDSERRNLEMLIMALQWVTEEEAKRQIQRKISVSRTNLVLMEQQLRTYDSTG
jgi:hypothetical protein